MLLRKIIAPNLALALIARLAAIDQFGRSDLRGHGKQRTATCRTSRYAMVTLLN